MYLKLSTISPKILSFLLSGIIKVTKGLLSISSQKPEPLIQYLPINNLSKLGGITTLQGL